MPYCPVLPKRIGKSLATEEVIRKRAFGEGRKATLQTMEDVALQPVSTASAIPLSTSAVSCLMRDCFHE